jgi:hypothetical protein
MEDRQRGGASSAGIGGGDGIGGIGIWVWIVKFDASEDDERRSESGLRSDWRLAYLLGLLAVRGVALMPVGTWVCA